MHSTFATSTPHRILVVEDEALVALYLEDILRDLGFDVVGPLMRLEPALAEAGRGIEAHAAILDVNIGGQKVFPLADRLEKAGMPLVFATGYGRASIEPRWHRYPILQKPYSTDEVSRALAAVLEPVAFEGGGLPDKSVRAPL